MANLRIIYGRNLWPLRPYKIRAYGIGPIYSIPLLQKAFLSLAKRDGNPIAYEYHIDKV